MATVVTAIADSMLRAACRTHLAAAGHVALDVERPLSLLTLDARLSWDALLVDDSSLGHRCLAVARQVQGQPLTLGLGIEMPGVTMLTLPLDPHHLLGLVGAATPSDDGATGLVLHLDPHGKRALVGDVEVRLSDTEYRLLRLLTERSPFILTTESALHQVWGQDDPDAGVSLLRVHVRNLRAKLAAAGLPNAIQSRRGQGYTLSL